MIPWFQHLKTPKNHSAAKWIWPAATAPRLAVETALFRATLQPPPGATHLELHLSAEGRYILWLGDSADALARGPARTDLHHRPLDTYSLDLRTPSDAATSEPAADV